MATPGDTPATSPKSAPTPTAKATRRVLILGGTVEARELAGLLIKSGYEPVTALAGITRNPAERPGETRKGGFGCAQGLADFAARQAFSALIDATHPFAVRISNDAMEAARMLGLPLLRLERPPWAPGPRDRWVSVADNAAAVSVLPAGARVLLTIGRKEVLPYFSRADIAGIARMIEPVDESTRELARNWRIMLARPPFSLEGEVQLLADNAISHLVTKNSGGEETAAKLGAARLKGIEVIMIERPQKPECASVADAQAALLYLDRVVSA